MAEWSGFFDAHKIGESWDRTYLAEDFAKFLAPLIGNGVFAGRSNELQVFQAVPAGMSVVLSSGQSWIEGYGYTNDSDLIIPIDPADGALGRIDRIVNQWSAVDRQIRTIWKKGTPAVNPVAPPLQWDADYKELNLCTLDITAGLSAITQDKIKDTRADSSVCGWVTGLIDQVDTDTLFAQWEAAYENEFAKQKAAWEKFFGDIQADLGVPIPSPDKADSVISVSTTGEYILSDKYLKKDDSGDLYMDNHRLVNVAGPVESGDAANKEYVDLMLPKSGGEMNGALGMGGNKITGLGAPTDAADAVPKSYAIDMKQSAVTLSHSRWSNGAITVSVDGVTKDTRKTAVITTAAAESVDAYLDSGVKCSGQGSGTITFICTDTPSEDLIVNVLILKKGGWAS